MKKALRKFGLNDNETNVYLACLELGSESVTRISERANTYRTLTYEVLKSLKEKGLVSSAIKDKKTYFEAAPPKTFNKILQEKEESIKKALPEMEALMKTVKKKPSITLYEGKDGIKNVLEHVLEETNEIRVLAANKAMKNILKYFMPSFFKRRLQKGIKVKAIVDGKPLIPELMEYKILKKTYTTGYWLYNDKVLFISFEKENPVAILIENKGLSKTMKMTFTMLWDNL